MDGEGHNPFRQFTVGMIEAKFNSKYPDVEKFVSGFTNGHYAEVWAKENGEVGYFINLPATAEEIEQLKLKDGNTLLFNHISCKLLVDGEKIDIRSVNGQKFWDRISEAKYVREKFLEYLKTEEIPYKVLLSLFD